jgi:uncharacterized protein DUF6152
MSGATRSTRGNERVLPETFLKPLPSPLVASDEEFRYSSTAFAPQLAYDGTIDSLILEDAVKRLLALVVIAVAMAGTGAFAHHPFARTYLEDKEITIEGEVAEWVYSEPHSFVHLIVRDSRNHTQRWIVECRGAHQLRRQGVSWETLKPGQLVIVTGSPGRVTPEYRLRLRALVRPQDGWRWSDAVD